MNRKEVIDLIRQNLPRWTQNGADVGRAQVIDITGSAIKDGDTIRIETGGGSGGGMSQHGNEYHDPDMALATHDHTGVYDPSGTAAAGDAAHVAATDPHPGYLKESLFQTAGDMVVAYNASMQGRVAIGTTDQVLTADSTQMGGMKWAPPKQVGFISFGFTASGQQFTT